MSNHIHLNINTTRLEDLILGEERFFPNADIGWHKPKKAPFWPEREDKIFTTLGNSPNTFFRSSDLKPVQDCCCKELFPDDDAYCITQNIQVTWEVKVGPSYTGFLANWAFSPKDCPLQIQGSHDQPASAVRFENPGSGEATNWQAFDTLWLIKLLKESKPTSRPIWVYWDPRVILQVDDWM